MTWARPNNMSRWRAAGLGEETHLTYQRQHSGWAVIPQQPAGVLNEAGLELCEAFALAWLDVRAHESRARTRNVQLSCHAHHFRGLGQRAAAGCRSMSPTRRPAGFRPSDGKGARKLPKSGSRCFRCQKRAEQTRDELGTQAIRGKPRHRTFSLVSRSARAPMVIGASNAGRRPVATAPAPSTAPSGVPIMRGCTWCLVIGSSTPVVFSLCVISRLGTPYRHAVREVYDRVRVCGVRARARSSRTASSGILDRPPPRRRTPPRAAPHLRPRERRRAPRPHPCTRPRRAGAGARPTASRGSERRARSRQPRCWWSPA